MVETKPKTAAALRTPKPKKKLGLTVPQALRLPHEDLIISLQEGAKTEQLDETLTSHTSQTSQTSMTSHTSADESSIAPTRDFTRVANSIGRQAVPAGLFTGKSKQLYDCLYSMTRGAIVPTRNVRISRPKLMAKAHIGSRVTFDANVERLISVGLVSVRHITGEHDGNEYTVYLPEEVSATMTSHTSLTSLTSMTGSAQNLDRLVRLETSQTRHTSSPEESTTYGMPKTSFKTNTEIDDDDALAPFTRAWRQAAKEITGREPSKVESARWQELADVLIMELKIAAARTTVSSVPSFLAEHLRRRLWKLDKKQMTVEGKPASESQAITSEQEARNCPECGGTGWRYRDGDQGRGVVRCLHENLNDQDQKTGES